MSTNHMSPESKSATIIFLIYKHDVVKPIYINNEDEFALWLKYQFKGG